MYINHSEVHIIFCMVRVSFRFIFVLFVCYRFLVGVVVFVLFCVYVGGGGFKSLESMTLFVLLCLVFLFIFVSFVSFFR